MTNVCSHATTTTAELNSSVPSESSLLLFRAESLPFQPSSAFLTLSISCSLNFTYMESCRINPLGLASLLSAVSLEMHTRCSITNFNQLSFPKLQPHLLSSVALCSLSEPPFPVPWSEITLKQRAKATGLISPVFRLSVTTDRHCFLSSFRRRLFHLFIQFSTCLQ